MVQRRGPSAPAGGAALGSVSLAPLCLRFSSAWLVLKKYLLDDEWSGGVHTIRSHSVLCGLVLSVGSYNDLTPIVQMRKLSQLTSGEDVGGQHWSQAIP